MSKSSESVAPNKVLANSFTSETKGLLGKIPDLTCGIIVYYSYFRLKKTVTGV